MQGSESNYESRRLGILNFITQVYNVVDLTAHFIAPLSIMSVCYYKIVRKILRKNKWVWSSRLRSKIRRFLAKLWFWNCLRRQAKTMNKDLSFTELLSVWVKSSRISWRTLPAQLDLWVVWLPMTTMFLRALLSRMRYFFSEKTFTLIFFPTRLHHRTE